jgi:hypothetical protein
MSKPRDGQRVVLEGDGMASVCAARLLTDAGVSCVLERNARPKLAAILLGEQTQHLLRELFPIPKADEGDEDLFEGFARISRRIVLWGDAPEPLNLPHRGVVAPEGELLARLWRRVPALASADPQQPVPAAGWRIQSTRANIAADQERCFGSRRARFALVELREGAEPEACWVESVADGWLFLLSLGGGKATLIAVGDTDTVDQLLAGSRLVATQVGRTLQEPSAPIPAYPRLLRSLVEGGRVACGTAAMSFDPLCGEGAGNAVREAFLAAALIRAGLAGADPAALANHYTMRLTQGFLRHLQICLQFYSTGGSGRFWEREGDSLRKGIQSLQAELNAMRATGFKLVDRDLVPL